MERAKSPRRSAMSIVAFLVVAVAVAACGSSNSSNTNSASASSAGGASGQTQTVAGSPATGSAVDVWTEAPVGAVGASAPQAGSGVRAGIRYINDHGGLGLLHQKVVVKECNTQLTPNGEIQCAQQAASDPNAIAIVSPIVVIATDQATAGAQKAGLAIINPAASAASTVTSPINFPLGSEYLDAAGCAVLVAKAANVTKIGFATTALPGSEAITALGAAAANKAGLTSVGTVPFPLTATDLTPYVTQLMAKNPQAVVLEASPQSVGAWLAAAARLGKSVPTCVGDRLIPNQVLTGLGALASNFYVAASYPDPSWSGYPLLTQFRQQAQAEVAAGDATASLAANNNAEDVLVGWLASQALLQAAHNVSGSLTRAKLLAALNHTTATFGANSAVLPPMNFGTPNPNKKFPRLFNTTMFLKKWDTGTKAFVRVTSVPSVNGSIVP